MSRWLFGPFVRGRGAVGLLIFRLVAGLAMALHGWPKFQHATSWMPPNAPIPAPLQAAAAASEFLGGIALMLGLLTPVAAFFIACTMAVATFMVHMGQGHPFVASNPGGPSYEAAAGYLAMAVMFLLTGPGTLSADAVLFDRAAAKPAPPADPTLA